MFVFCYSLITRLSHHEWLRKKVSDESTHRHEVCEELKYTFSAFSEATAEYWSIQKVMRSSLLHLSFWPKFLCGPLFSKMIFLNLRYLWRCSCWCIDVYFWRLHVIWYVSQRIVPVCTIFVLQKGMLHLHHSTFKNVFNHRLTVVPVVFIFYYLEAAYVLLEGSAVIGLKWMIIYSHS